MKKLSVVIKREDGTVSKFDSATMDRMFDEAWDRVDPQVRKRAVEILRTEISEEELALIREAVEEHGPHDWHVHPPFSQTVEYSEDIIIPVPFHSSGGMAIRNLLREKGLRDDALPPFDEYYGEGTDVRNWDDYYLQAIVEACT